MGKILRRTFLIGTAAIAGGVAFGAYKLNKEYPNPLKDQSAKGDRIFNPYVKITSDNQITIMIPRAEMGQGISTTLAALVAEELDVEMSSIKTEMAPAGYAYYNAAMMADGAPLAHYNRSMVAEMTRSSMEGLGKILGMQVTGGSSSISDAYERLREAGASARETLKQVAANRSGTKIEELTTESGHVILPDGKKYSYGELAESAAKLKATTVKLRPSSEWKILGKSTPRTDVLAKSTGAPIFGIDIDLPDMVYATVRMNPRLGGSMESMDASKAKQVKGVLDVIDISGPEEEVLSGGFAVIATNTWAAFKGADAVEAEWGDAPYPATTEEIFKTIETALDGNDGDNLRNDGDVGLLFADAPQDKLVQAEYRVPYLAHSTMEPMNATAQFKNGRLDIWTGTQAPTVIRADCAYEVGIEEDKAFVHTTYLGGGFGRRIEVDFPRYAARIAKHTKGKPVKVVWTREEDMTHDTYRPASISRWKARLDDDGLPVAVQGLISTPSVVKSVMARTFPSISAAGPDNTITHGAFDQPYAIENYNISGIKAPVDIPIGFWRSVGNSYNGFYHESFMDEIAVQTGMDPIELRLKLMKEHPAALGVVKKVAEMSDWTAPKQEGRAKGMAFTLSFGTWVAQVVEVAQTDDGIKIENIWCAADIGEALDPAIVKAQLQSAIIYGLSSAIGQEITFKDGKVEQENFDTYDAMRMNQCPLMHIEVMQEAEHRGGAGEPGTPPSIPALANAIHALTGQRIRTMPLSNTVEFMS